MKILFKMSILIVLFSCGRFKSSDKSISLIDSLEKPTERIVCISKQCSEIIYALGAEKNIVAVDISSTYPEKIKALPTIGYHRALSAEAILAMEPSLIIHDNNIGPEQVVNQLIELNIPMQVFYQEDKTIEGTQALISEIGAFFGKEKKAKELCEKLNQEMMHSLKARKNYHSKPNVLVVHFGQANNVYLAVTENSTAAQIVKWAGGKLSTSGEGGMAQLSAEVVAASNPDVILLTDFGYDKLGSMEEIGKLPGISETKAYQKGRVYRVEEHDLIYLGPRTGKIVLELQELIHHVE